MTNLMRVTVYFVYEGNRYIFGSLVCDGISNFYDLLNGYERIRLGRLHPDGFFQVDSLLWTKIMKFLPLRADGVEFCSDPICDLPNPDGVEKELYIGPNDFVYEITQI